MTKEIIRIKNEKALLMYLYKMLSLGYTDGIKEEEYFNFISMLVERVNSDDSILAERVEMESESFSDIVEKAMTILEKSCKRPKQPLLYREMSGKGMIIPTYDLKWVDVLERKISLPQSQTDIANTLFEELIPKVELSDYDWANFDNLDGAKKVGSFYVNELAERYVKERINAGAWQLDCTSVDSCIFDIDIAALTQQEGTKEAFTKAYLHAVRTVAQIKDNAARNDIVMFSNNPKNPLAYANYLKLVLPEEINFLKRYGHIAGSLNNAAVDVFTIGSNAWFESVTCTEVDPNGVWSGINDRTSGEIDEGPVKIMEKRIGNRFY